MCYNIHVMIMDKKHRKILVYFGIGCLLLFAGILIAVVTSNIAWFDEAVGTIFVRNEVLTNFMRGITFLGEADSLIFIGVLITIFHKDKIEGAESLLGLGLVAGLNSIIKKIIRRPRPSIVHLVEVGGFSFPSGHSSSSIAFYGFLIYLVCKKCKNPVWKRVTVAFLIVLILAIGISRIYLGVHYPSDVLAGFSFGLGTLILYINLIEWFRDKK